MFTCEQPILNDILEMRSITEDMTENQLQDRTQQANNGD